MGLVTRTEAVLGLIKEPPCTKAVKLTLLPLPTVALGVRTALIVTRSK
jgi:hypothetical protein